MLFYVNFGITYTNEHRPENDRLFSKTSFIFLPFGSDLNSEAGWLHQRGNRTGIVFDSSIHLTQIKISIQNLRPECLDRILSTLLDILY